MAEAGVRRLREAAAEARRLYERAGFERNLTSNLCYLWLMLNPTPRGKMLDRQNRPYFLWDCDLDVEQFRERLEHSDPAVRAYFVGKLMRQAKPDDVFEFVSPRVVRELWPELERYLGDKRPFWSWLFSAWESQGRVWR